MSDSELVVINNDATPATYVEPEQDNGNWGDDDDASLPQFISMKQALTEGMDHVPNGVFFHRGSGQTWETINMVILKMGKTRQWKPSAPKFVADEKALCRSNDRKVPVTDDDRLIPQAKDCAACPKASWDGYDKKTNTGPKPTCSKEFFILFLDEETNLPYIYTATGQGVDPAEAMYEAIRSRAKIVKAKTGKMPFTYDFVVTMTSEKGNKAFKPKFTTVRQLTPDDAAKYGPLFQQFVASRKNITQESVAPIDNEYVATEDTGQVIEADEPVAI